MSTKTTNYGLTKPDTADFYDISVFNNNADIIDSTLKAKADQTEVDALKKSVSDGKTLVANAITGKGVTTATDAAFATMATNIGSIKLGTDTSGATASASDILKSKTAGVKGAMVTGTMANNGAVNQALGINGTYTIPVGFHNGSGKVTQSITTKAAATYTPGENAQTIASGQYLSGVQTISAVPTETKTVTAGTSAQTVNRTSGKYMTAVTVNPTPSQAKTVTLTSSPLTVYPDSGQFLSSVTINASLGRKYASGNTNWVQTSTGTNYFTITSWSLGSTTTESKSTLPQITLPISFTPSIVKITFTSYTNQSYTITLVPTDVVGQYRTTVNEGGTDFQQAMLSVSNLYIKWLDVVNKVVWLPRIDNMSTTSTAITWEAWE